MSGEYFKEMVDPGFDNILSFPLEEDVECFFFPHTFLIYILLV